MPRSLTAIRRMLLANGYRQGHHSAVITLEHLDPRAVAGWVFWKLDQHQLGPVRRADISRIQVLGDRNALAISGEPVAVNRLQRLIEDLDVSPATAITLSCVPVDTTRPQRLLCQPRLSHLVDLPDGTQMDAAADEVNVGRLAPVEPDYADEMVVVVNPFVDPDEVEKMVEEGVGTIGDQPRFIEHQGLAGTVTFECQHKMPNGRSGLRLAALMGQDGLMTVQASIRCSGCALDNPLAQGESATVQYTAYPGQTVAVGVLPATGITGIMTVLLITADAVGPQRRKKR